MGARLTPVSFNYKRFATEKEKLNESYYIDEDGMITNHRVGYTELPRGFNKVSLTEARDVYLKIVKSLDVKEGEKVSNLKFDLIPYYQYNENGTPVLASEEYPESHLKGDEKSATYNPQLNRLRIWVRGNLVYQNWDGLIEKDQAALADTYL